MVARNALCSFLTVTWFVCSCIWSFADEPPTTKENGTAPAAVAAGETPTPTAGSAPAAPPPAHVAILKDTQELSGMMTWHQKGPNLFAELTAADYNGEFIVLLTISKGISQDPLIGGYSWNMGDDWLWSFRKVNDRVHVIRNNVRFKANKGFPEAIAVSNAYTDSVLFSLPILGKGPKGGDLVSLSPIFMGDLPQISSLLPGFAFASDRSNIAPVKMMDQNAEVEVEATYASSGRMSIDTVADSRGVSINVHYSISRLPATSYQPRLADDRVGYFLTVHKDFNKTSDKDQFVRFVNRWHLEPAPGSTQPPHPVKQSIVFWIEKTVPHKYRPVVREAIEEWNKAFEKAGWLGAIEVRQQKDTDDWEPEDINYNTFRWITAGAGFAMGPSRVNPRTGQILDADIIFDADFLTFWKQEFETLTPERIAARTGGALDIPHDAAGQGLFRRSPTHDQCLLSVGRASQFAFGSAAIGAVHADPKLAGEELEKLIQQGLKETVMHEVGHTLGLRHNFKGSRQYSVKDLNDPTKTANGELVGSVMDYNPTNIVPKDWKQGQYYATTIGPYDYWAIEYGYKPLSGGTSGEVAELAKIASRSGEAGLAYATDEDTTGLGIDPDTNRFDLGNDATEYARLRAQIVEEVLPNLMERLSKEGDDYTKLRRAFGVLLSDRGQAMFYASRYIGGIHTNRSHKGDKDAAAPAVPVDTKSQRDVLTMLEEQVFSDKPFQFPHELYGYLVTSNWSHWGMDGGFFIPRVDYPIHDVILMWQTRVLDQLLSSVTLERIHDLEYKTPADKDLLTAAELVERLTKAIFSELDTVKEGEFTNRKPAISSTRRNLQREFLRKLSNMAMGRTGVPEDCMTITYAELSSLEARIGQMLKSNIKLDSYTRAHLQESSSRIQKVLEAKLTLNTP